ncbi:MAG: hypothetical protein J2P25_03560 [Nocardiopsaceae bacterium]|nr:hypothetical protein [Nocardiopsaceae bacterium]
MAPSYHALLAVDAEGFSRNRDIELPGLHTEIRRAVECACDRSGLGDAWRTARVRQHSGDGLFAILPEQAAISLIHPFGRQVQDILAEGAPRLRADGLRLRLRIALHAGLVDDERPVTAGISTATNDVHRLLECEPLKAALADSDPDLTLAAMVVSAEMFDVYVRGGHTRLRASQFTPVAARVKQFDRTAFLYVPVPSRRPADADAAPGAPDDSVGLGEHGGSGGVSLGEVSVTGDGAQNVIGNQVGGDIRQRRS